MAHNKLGVMKKDKGKKPMSSLGAKLQKQMLFEFDDDVSGGDEGVDLSAKLDRLLAGFGNSQSVGGIMQTWPTQSLGLPRDRYMVSAMHTVGA